MIQKSDFKVVSHFVSEFSFYYFAAKIKSTQISNIYFSFSELLFQRYFIYIENIYILLKKFLYLLYQRRCY